MRREREKERNKNLSPHEHDIMCFIFDSISCGGERENREKIKKSREKKENRKARFFAAAKTIYETYTYRYRYTEERERMWNKDDEKSLWLYMLYMSYKYDDDEILTNACKFSNILIDIYSERKREEDCNYIIYTHI